MATNVILPALGMAQDTGKIVQWLKAEGEAVREGEFIAEIETDKATVELEAPATGTLARLHAAGDEVPVGQAIAVILADGETASAVLATSVVHVAHADALGVASGNSHEVTQSSATMTVQSADTHRAWVAQGQAYCRRPWFGYRSDCRQRPTWCCAGRRCAERRRQHYPA